MLLTPDKTRNALAVKLLLAACLLFAGNVLHDLPVHAAQKVAVNLGKGADFTRYKRFAWHENYLITALTAEDQKRIDAVLRNSIEQELRNKGFVPDKDHPDFFVSYEAGGLIQGGTGAKTQGFQPDSPTQTWSSAYPAGAPMDVWTSTLAKMRVTISDSSNTSQKIWQATASQKIGNHSCRF